MCYKNQFKKLRVTQPLSKVSLSTQKRCEEPEIPAASTITELISKVASQTSAVGPLLEELASQGKFEMSVDEDGGYHILAWGGALKELPASPALTITIKPYKNWPFAEGLEDS